MAARTNALRISCAVSWGAAAALIDEERLIADVTGTSLVSYAAMMLAAWRGREPEATELIAAPCGKRPPEIRAFGRLRGLRGRTMHRSMNMRKLVDLRWPRVGTCRRHNSASAGI